MLSNTRGHRRLPSGLHPGQDHPALHQPPNFCDYHVQASPTLGYAPIIRSTVKSTSYNSFPLELRYPGPKPESTLPIPPTPKHRGSRTRSSSSEFGTFQNSKFLFTPASTPSNVVSSSPPSAPKIPPNKPASSPLFRSRTPPYNSKPFYPYGKSYSPPRMQVDSEDERDDDDGLIYTSWHEPTGHTMSSTHLRTRGYSASSVTALSRGRDKPAKCISTTPGHYGAGETETEIDEPVSARFSVPSFAPELRRCTASGRL
jgi:hypothetical protein